MKFFLSSHLSFGIGGREREVEFLHYMEVIASFDMVAEIFGCIRMRWSTFDETEQEVCGKEVEIRSVDVG